MSHTKNLAVYDRIIGWTPTLVSTQFAVFGLIEIMSYPISPSDPPSTVFPAPLRLHLYRVYFYIHVFISYSWDI